MEIGGEPVHVPGTKTIKPRISQETNTGKLDALEQLVAVWDGAVTFHTGLFLGTCHGTGTTASPGRGRWR